MTERSIQVAVARADIIICSALQWLAILVPLTIVLVLAVLAARKLAGQEVQWIDYDRPGVDITSEGPEEDFTKAWRDVD